MSNMQIKLMPFFFNLNIPFMFLIFFLNLKEFLTYKRSTSSMVALSALHIFICYIQIIIF